MKKIQLCFFLIFIISVGCSDRSDSENINNIPWSFTVLADPMGDGDTFQNALLEIRAMSTNPVPKISESEFILVAGDMVPVKTRYAEYKEVFKKNKYMKSFFPVKGNHDVDDEPTPRFMIDTILPEQKNIVMRDAIYANYHVKWKNVYMIVVDAYSDLGENGCINNDGLLWVKNIIESAPESIDHIFISFHEPAFPRYRHLSDSFNACEEQRDAFWKMLVNYRDIVKAVFVGHTHSYYKMRVFDPQDSCSNNPECFPDDVNGIYQIDVGASGRGERNTIVQVQVKGKEISIRVKESEEGAGKPFSVIDEWRIEDSEEYLSGFENDICIPKDYPTIQIGIEAANNSDKILILPGEYHENLNITGKNIILSSKYDCKKDTTCLERTIIDGMGQTVVNIGAGADGSTINGFTIQNGNDGLSVRSNVSIVNNYIKNNVDGIDYESGSGICKGNIIIENEDDAIDLDGATEVEIRDNILTNNGDDGIEIRLHPYNGSVLINNINHNVIGENGEDGIQFIDYDGLSDRKFSINRNLIYDNAMAAIGCMADGNTVEDYQGAPIPEMITVTNNTFSGNSYGITGGAFLVALNNLFLRTANTAMKNVATESIASHNLFWSNAVDYSSSNIDVITNLFDTDPLLEENYTLPESSVAVDAGSSFFELNGVILINIDEKDYSGSAPDIGWYETIDQ